jgi:hypothetical protein
MIFQHFDPESFGESELVNQAVDLYLDADMHDSRAPGHRPIGGCQAVFSIRIALE